MSRAKGMGCRAKGCQYMCLWRTRCDSSGGVCAEAFKVNEDAQGQGFC